MIAGWGKALEIPNEHDFYLNYVYCHTRKCHLNFVKCMIMWQCGNFFKNLFFKVSKNSRVLKKLEVKYIRNKTCQKIESESGSDFVIKGGLISEVKIFILAPSSKNVGIHYPQYLNQLAESFCYIDYGPSIIKSKVSQIIAVMKK